MKKFFLMTSFCLGLCGCETAKETSAVVPENKPTENAPIVYFTEEITPESLVKIYEALGKVAKGRVAVKISTGEFGGHNYLKPELIKELVTSVKGTLVECNAAYPGKRDTTEAHLKTVAAHGFDKIAKVDIMDAEGEIKIPLKDTKHLKYDLVGKNLQNYDFMINLAHFKGHAMGGFGGVLKNQSIGVASANGKAYIHSAGKKETPDGLWGMVGSVPQDSFLEAMAAAAQGVHEYFKGENIVYINVMNNMSVDCDCDSNPDKPKIKDIGILASLDPVACDQAALDLVFSHKDSPSDDAKPLQERINRQHGTYITDYAEKIGLGSKKYTLKKL